MQETLAPALEFLTSEEATAPGKEFAGVFESGRSGARPPFITVEALAVARQAASELTARATAPRVHWRQLAAKSLSYAAVFAAGLFLASALFEMRDRPAPAIKLCTRGEAARDDVNRTKAEITTLANSCAACHVARPTSPPDGTTTLGPSRTTIEEWLQELLRDETLVAIAGDPTVETWRDLG
jgi:hypothetical protein